MKKFLILIALLIWADPANAQFCGHPGFCNKSGSGGGGGPLVWTATASPTPITSGAQTANFGSQSIGTSSADRNIAVLIENRGAAANANANIVSVTIDFGSGDTAMTQALQTNVTVNKNQMAVYYLPVPGAATTAIFKVTVAAAGGWSDAMSIFVGKITGSTTTSVASTIVTQAYPQGFPTAAAVSIPTGGLALFTSVADGSGADTFTWTNATKGAEQVYVGGGSGLVSGTAYSTTSATVSLNFSNAGGAQGWVAGVFKP